MTAALEAGAVWYRCTFCRRVDWTASVDPERGSRLPFGLCDGCGSPDLVPFDGDPRSCPDCKGARCVGCDYSGTSTCQSCGAYVDREPVGGEVLCVGCDVVADEHRQPRKRTQFVEVGMSARASMAAGVDAAVALAAARKAVGKPGFDYQLSKRQDELRALSRRELLVRAKAAGFELGKHAANPEQIVFALARHEVNTEAMVDEIQSGRFEAELRRIS